jgi:hypothetical protein
LPENLVGDVGVFKITEFFLAHFKIQAARSKRTALTPPVAIIINAGNMFRFFRLIIGRLFIRGQDTAPPYQW